MVAGGTDEELSKVEGSGQAEGSRVPMDTAGEGSL